MTFYNLFLFLSTRDKIYALYTLYVVTVSFGLFFINGYPLLTDNFWWTYNIFWLGILASPVSIFAIFYLDLRKTSSFMYKTIITLSIFAYVILPLLNLIGVNSVELGMPFQSTIFIIRACS